MYIEKGVEPRVQHGHLVSPVKCHRHAELWHIKAFNSEAKIVIGCGERGWMGVNAKQRDLVLKASGGRLTFTCSEISLSSG